MADKKIEILITAEDKASAALQGIGKNVSNLQSHIKTVGVTFAAIGAATAVMAKSFIDAASTMEQQRVAFETLVGDANRGRQALDDLISFAAKTPFEIPQILEQSKRLLAMGTTAEDLIPTFRMLGDVAAGVGMEKLPQLVLAFGQIQARGKLMGTELRQLTEAGFNLADAMGVSSGALTEMVENGEVSFEDVKQAFANVTSEGGRFHNMMQNQSQTTAGKISNLSDNMFKLRAAMGEALLPAVNKLVEAILPMIERFAAFSREHPQLVAGLVAVGLALGVIGAVIVAVAPIVTALISLFTVLASPIGLLVIGIGLLVAAGYLLYQNWDMISQAASQIWSNIVTTITNALNGIKDFFVGIWTSIKEWFIAFWETLINNDLVQFLVLLATTIFNWLMVIYQFFDLIWTLIKAVIEVVLYAILAVINLVWSAILAVINAHLNAIKAVVTFVWNAIKDEVNAVMNVIKTIFNTVWTAIKTIVSVIIEELRSIIKKKIDESAESVNTGVNAMKGFFNGLIDAIKSVINWFNDLANAARNALNAAKEAIQGGVGGIKGALGFQHGGVVPGSFNQAVPAILHGGERVVPRTGVDVNPPASGGGGAVNIIIEGDVNSIETLDRIVEAVKSAIGRDNELAQQGVAV